MRRTSQRGAIVAFVVVIVAALFMLIGLVVDGGRILTARAHASDDAQEAARAGAQQLNQSLTHSGTGTALDPVAASAAAQTYLEAAGDVGTVGVSGDSVTVTVTTSLPMQMLGLIGLGTATVSETQTARAVRGVVGGP